MDLHPEETADSIPLSQLNEINQNFFNAHLSADEDIKSIRNNILKQEQQKPFVEKFVNYAGYPVWDKAVINIETATESASKLNYKNGNQKFIFIPLARYKDSTVHAILKVKINRGDTSFRVMYRWQYNQNGYKENSKFNTADQNALFFMGFESYVFGHNSFKIKDSLLLKGRGSDTIHIQSFNGNPAVDLKTMSYWITICYYTRHLSNERTTSTVPVVEVCVTFLTSDGGGDSGNSGNGNSGSTGTGGGGSTGGGNWNDDPCYTPAEPRVQIPQPCDETDPGWLPVPDHSKQPDPCDVIQPFADKATLISKDLHFSQAKSDIQAAAVDGKEHSVVFGKDAQGNISSSPMNNGDESSGTINTNWPGGFADLHNHPDDQPPSPGDLYGIISVNQIHVDYDTRYVITSDGSVYALIVTDLTLASKFVNDHPKQQIPHNPPYPPDFPDPIFTDFDNARTYFEYNGFTHLIAEEKAMALVLDKYNSGIALLKQDANGNFKKLGTTETTNSDGTKTYTANNCP